MSITPLLDRHHDPRNFSDRIAYAVVVFMRFFADAFFARRYGHRDARLHDVIIAVRADEVRHREVNHELADTLD